MRRPLSLLLPLLCAGAALGWPSDARAIVTQVDGQVLPLTNRLQLALDRPVAQGGEGTAGLVNAVFDAAVTPEVFLIPKESNGNYRTVEFRDIEEGAGYENTIGWYNVADPTTLYPVLTCTPVNHEVGAVVNVNFETEFQAGRYLGGYIGFFLVSPAGDTPNCGDPNNLGVAGKNTFIVYTESQLNGDGNYVHYLIYNSVQNPLAYYFGFEDLWRGGDNDFEDMAVKVTGLIKACEPTQEICDGLDNNCDGLIDNDPVDVGGNCTQIAGNNPGVGPCKAGTLVCASTGPGDTTKICTGEVGPSAEVCNNLDDDCNGVVDDNPSDAWLHQPCGPTDEGACELGHDECVVGIRTCLDVVGPSPEFCDGADNNCDGVVDGTVPATPTSCTTDADCDTSAPFCLPSSVLGGSVCTVGPLDAVGNCVFAGSTCPGVRRCVGGAITCVETTTGTQEVCDGADNDCDGFVDEGDPGGGGECGPGGISLEMAKTGQCLPGIEHCIGAQLACVGGRGPSPEICDGLDNDCDGQTDQTAECPGESQCIEGKCAEACGTGEFPCPGGLACIDGYCVKNPGGTGGSAGDAGGDAGGDASAGSGGGPGGSGGSGVGGTGGAKADGGAAASSGSFGEPRENWGLATGGGGSSCAVGRAPASVPAAVLALLALAWATRRRARSAGTRRSR